MTTSDYIRKQARIAVDPVILKLREELFGVGVAHGVIQDTKIPPTVIRVTNIDAQTSNLGFIKGVTTLSGGTLIGTIQKELSFVNAGVTTVGDRTTIVMPTWGTLADKPTEFTPSTHNHALVTTTTSGFMSAADKVKLNAYPAVTGLTPTYVLTVQGDGSIAFSAAGSSSLPNGTVSGQVLTWDGDSWEPAAPTGGGGGGEVSEEIEGAVMLFLQQQNPFGG